jgi:hypothetical protein
MNYRKLAYGKQVVHQNMGTEREARSIFPNHYNFTAVRQIFNGFMSGGIGSLLEDCDERFTRNALKILKKWSVKLPRCRSLLFLLVLTLSLQPATGQPDFIIDLKSFSVTIVERKKFTYSQSCNNI